MLPFLLIGPHFLNEFEWTHASYDLICMTWKLCIGHNLQRWHRELLHTPLSLPWLTSHTTMEHLSQVSMLYTYYNFDSFSLMSFSCSRDPSRLSHYLIFPYPPLVCDSFSEISCFCCIWWFWGILFKYFTDATQFGFFWCFSYC